MQSERRTIVKYSAVVSHLYLSPWWGAPPWYSPWYGGWYGYRPPPPWWAEMQGEAREGGEGGPRHARPKAVERLPVVVFDVGRTGACKRLDRPVGVARHAHSVPLREVRIELDVYEASLHAGDGL